MKQHELALVFLQKAAEDEAAAEELLVSRRVGDGIIGFHYQRAGEKLLKAMLLEPGMPFRRTHDLLELMGLLSDAGHPLPSSLSNLDTLTPYATFLRYEAMPPESTLDRPEAQQMVRRLRAHAESCIVRGERNG